MVIEKILNNNVVVTKNAEGEEIIVMGRGLAFKKKVGDDIDPAMVDKEFHLTSKDAKTKFQELIADIPMENLELAEEIISYAKAHLGKRLNEMIYISLVDQLIYCDFPLSGWYHSQKRLVVGHSSVLSR